MANIGKTLREFHEANNRGMERLLGQLPKDELEKVVTNFVTDHNARVRAWEHQNAHAQLFADHIYDLSEYSGQIKSYTVRRELVPLNELGWTGYYGVHNIAFFKEETVVDEKVEAAADLHRKYEYGVRGD